MNTKLIINLAVMAGVTYLVRAIPLVLVRKKIENRFVGNTTIGIIITNASFDKAQLTKIASMAHNGYARSINPVHTLADGDSIYAVSTGELEADQDLAGTIGAEVMSEAIIRAVMSAESAYGLMSAKEFLNKNRK